MGGGSDVDTEVADRLERLLGAPVEGLERLSGGASRETWAFRAGGRALILRRDPPGRSGDFGSMGLEAGGGRGPGPPRPGGAGGGGGGDGERGGGAGAGRGPGGGGGGAPRGPP